MRFTKSLIIAAALSFIATASAADIKVIANSSVGASEVSGSELKEVFLLNKNSLADGSHVTPVIEKGGAAHEAFLQTYLGKTDAALSTYYRSLVFTGKASMPKTLASDADVVEYVGKTKGAIGYVSAGTAATGVKTLEVK